MVECDVAVLDVLSIEMEEHTTEVKLLCPDFVFPCPRVVVTNFTGTIFGATFKIGYTTDLPVKCRFRQRQVVGGVPAAWSPWLPFVQQPGNDPPHTTYETDHPQSEHGFSNKAASSTWDYQLQLELEEDPVYREIYPQCGYAVIRAQYPPKTDPGGGIFDPEQPIDID